jgi:predicted regulator of Ras-like GTPase activity (Roadblock/LC7/MglB family)
LRLWGSGQAAALAPNKNDLRAAALAQDELRILRRRPWRALLALYDHGLRRYNRSSILQVLEASMVNSQMVMYEEEFNQIQTVVTRLVRDANAKVVFIVDKNGQLIAAAGDVDNVDTTSLASLTAGNIAATGGMAKLLKEQEFATQFHEGERANIHIQLVGNRVILVVIFDTKSSLGLVRLRVKKASEELNTIFENLLKKVHEPGADSPFAEITDEDIDNLFND